MGLLIIGCHGGTNVGDSFFRAAKDLKLIPTFLNTQEAFKVPRLIRYLNWYLLGRRPPKIDYFSKQVIKACMDYKPKWLLSIGIAPVHKKALEKIGEFGIKSINYLTDDPWNKSHFSSWFLRALPYYDIVYSTRRTNIDDLLKAGCKRVEYLPFGYDHELFYPGTLTDREKQRYDSDVVFVGGADKDRIPYIHALVKSGFKVTLYGSYWEKYPETRGYTLGQADVQVVRNATIGAKIALCLVRKANRDGHSMRSFEIPAIGACMLTEDTPEHREIFGEEGKNVLYFGNIDELIKKTQFLVNNSTERKRLANNVRALIVNGNNTYKDRFLTMLREVKP